MSEGESHDKEQVLHPRQFAMSLQKLIPPSYATTLESSFALALTASLAMHGILPSDLKIDQTENTLKIWSEFFTLHQKLATSGKSPDEIKRYFSDVQGNLEEQ
jgi:hypothetical protein